MRKGAFLALMQLDGSADAVWQLTGASARLRIDLLRAAAAAPEGPALDSLRAAVLPWFRDAVAAGAAAGTAAAAGDRPLRAPRAPGPGTVLSVTEVQVFSRGENVARKGTATQSSIVAGGATGGHARRAIDGGVEPACRPARIRSRARSSSRAPNRIPGGSWTSAPSSRSTPSPCGPRPPTRGPASIVTVLDANRKPVFVQDALRLQAPMTR